MEREFSFEPASQTVKQPELQEGPTTPELQLPIKTVNYHLLDTCNMSCDFCFATFADVALPDHYLPREKAIQVVQEVVGMGFTKINFAGGEPFMVPHLADLVKTAKEINPAIITSVVTNGSVIAQKGIDVLRQFEVGGVNQLDILALSIDSIDPEVLELSGRRTRKQVLSEEAYLEIYQLAAECGIKNLKINTVVSEANWLDDMRPFIRKVEAIKKLLRWKIIGMSRVIGQKADELSIPYEITDREYDVYWSQNTQDMQGIVIAAEHPSLVANSYIMVNPAGSFFTPSRNGQGQYVYSSSIIDVGAVTAFKGIERHLDRESYLKRDGAYHDDARERAEKKAAVEAYLAAFETGNRLNPEHKGGADPDLIVRTWLERIRRDDMITANFWQQQLGNKFFEILPNFLRYSPLLAEDGMIDDVVWLFRPNHFEKGKEVLKSMKNMLFQEFMPSVTRLVAAGEVKDPALVEEHMLKIKKRIVAINTIDEKIDRR